MVIIVPPSAAAAEGLRDKKLARIHTLELRASPLKATAQDIEDVRIIETFRNCSRSQVGLMHANIVEFLAIAKVS